MGDALRTVLLGGKYDALGASNLQWKTFNASDDSLTVSSVREVAANLPSAAKKVIGETAEVTQTEKWTRSGDDLTCQISITTKGAPGGLRNDDGDACRRRVHVDVGL